MQSSKDNLAFLLCNSQRKSGVDDEKYKKERVSRISHTHCKKSEHGVENCFELIESLEWYKSLKENEVEGL